MRQDPDHANRKLDSQKFEKAKLVKFTLILAFECHSHTRREYIRNHRQYTYHFINAGMQSKNKVRDNIINKAESNNKDPRSPLAGSESSCITRIYDGTTLTPRELTAEA